MQKFFSSLLQIGLCSFGYLYATSNIALAQVTPDGTVNTIVNQNGSIAEITGGETRGSHLFHSFQDFSVPTDNEAFFNNANSISNIFSRVTGGNISNIDGLIRANGSASLFLINPAGIIFGENARLDIGGSFYGSSASSILFEDGEFSAVDLENPPLLTVNAPIGLGFRDDPGNITVRGNGQGTRGSRGSTELIDTEDALRVDSDDTFVLAGGNLIFEGATIKTAGGRIELGSIEGSQTINLQPVGTSFSLDYENVTSYRDIQLSETATIDASGEGSGIIRIAGKAITMTDGSTIETSTLGSSPGQSFDIFASDSIELIGSGALSTGLFAQVKSGATGIGSSLSITTNNLEIKNGGVINTSTFGNGDGGDVLIISESINVEDDPSVDGDFTAILTQVDIDVEGNGGVLTFDSDNINFRGQDVFISVSTFGNGDSGELNIFTDRLSVSDGAEVQAITFAGGDGGKLTIEASNFVQIDGFFWFE